MQFCETKTAPGRLRIRNGIAGYPSVIVVDQTCLRDVILRRVRILRALLAHGPVFTCYNRRGWAERTFRALHWSHE
jgi:hypothetical protein